MDQTVGLKPGNRRLAVESLSDFVAKSVDASPAFDKPFAHLVLDHVFPEDIYEQMLTNCNSCHKQFAGGKHMLAP